jgi:Zn-dependent peptidase ImmA (M78 family)
MFKLPKKIDLGSIVYKVEEVDKLLDADGGSKLSGQISPNKSTIRVETRNSHQMQVITIYHEVFHHILRSSGQESAINPEREEEVIEALTSGWVAALRKNPGLTKIVEELDA